MWKRLADSLKAIRAALVARADSFVREGFALAGAISIIYGVSLMHTPSAFLIGGGICLVVAWGRAQ